MCCEKEAIWIHLLKFTFQMQLSEIKSLSELAEFCFSSLHCRERKDNRLSA